MALEVSPTPVLSGKDAALFLKRVQELAKKPAHRVNTSKLAIVAERIKKQREQAGDHRPADRVVPR